MDMFRLFIKHGLFLKFKINDEIVLSFILPDFVKREDIWNVPVTTHANLAQATPNSKKYCDHVKYNKRSFGLSTPIPPLPKSLHYHNKMHLEAYGWESMLDVEQEHYKVSICMPYYERWKPLEKTLASFIEMGYFEYDYPCSIEIIIVDDGSEREPISKYVPDPSKYDPPFRLVELPKKSVWQTPCVPLNRAVENATHPLILFQSPETYHVMPVIEKMAKMLTNTKDVVSCGCKNHLLKWVADPRRNSNFLWWCQMLTRDFFNSIGGFDESYRDVSGGEDNDYANRLTLAKCTWKWLSEEYYVVHGWESDKSTRTENLGRTKLISQYDKIARRRIKVMQRGRMRPPKKRNR